MPTDTDQKLQAIFRAVFEQPAGADTTRFKQGDPEQWDSLAHVSLVAAIESEFGLTIDAGDSLRITSYTEARAVLAEQGR